MAVVGLICPMHVISPDFDVTFAALWLLIQNEIAKTAQVNIHE